MRPIDRKLQRQPWQVTVTIPGPQVQRQGESYWERILAEQAGEPLGRVARMAPSEYDLRPMKSYGPRISFRDFDPLKDRAEGKRRMNKFRNWKSQAQEAKNVQATISELKRERRAQEPEQTPITPNYSNLATLQEQAQAKGWTSE